LCEYSNCGYQKSHDPARAWDVPALIDEREGQIIETLKSWGAAPVRQEMHPDRTALGRVVKAYRHWVIRSFSACNRRSFRPK